MEIATLIVEYLRVLVWPMLVTGVIIAFHQEVSALLARIRRAEFAGIAIDLPEAIAEAKVLSERVEGQTERRPRRSGPSIPLTEANQRMLQVGLRPSPSGLDFGYYRDLAEQDPNLALAGLRIEIDILARNLARGFQIGVGERETGSRLLRTLFEQNAITAEQMHLTLRVLQVCNAAVHGQPITREEAHDVIDTAGVLANQFLAWLSWGFPDGWYPTKTDVAEVAVIAPGPGQ